LEIKGITIPPLFKLFYNTFNVLDFSSLKYYQFYSDEYKEIINFGIIESDIYRGDNIVDSIFEIKLIEDNYDKLAKSADEIIRLNVEGSMPFGISPSNDYILVGLVENNRDFIFLQTADLRLLLADNIFDFFRIMQLVPEPNKWMPDLRKLYKNWGEDFWRVRE
jgi:hypothetical protein